MAESQLRGPPPPPSRGREDQPCPNVSPCLDQVLERGPGILGEVLKEAVVLKLCAVWRQLVQAQTLLVNGVKSPTPLGICGPCFESRRRSYPEKGDMSPAHPLDLSKPYLRTGAVLTEVGLQGSGCIRRLTPEHWHRPKGQHHQMERAEAQRAAPWPVSAQPSG